MLLGLQTDLATTGGDPVTFWLMVLGVVLLALGAAAAWLALGKLRDLNELAGRLTVLDEIKRQLAGLSEERGDIDLRRLQHILIDIRDGLRGVEDAVLGAVSASRATEGESELPAVPQLGERVTNRLLALGYEQVELVEDSDELAKIAVAQEGEVRVEAKRNGALYKGCIRLRAGRIQGVEMAPCYSLFP